MTSDPWHVAVGVLRLASQLTDGIQAGLAREGFTDVRPAHGFAFVRVAVGDATIADVAAHLGVSKQAARVLVGQLEAAGYLERAAHPTDGRAQLLALTQRGWACTEAAARAAADTVEGWRERLSAAEAAGLDAALARIVTPGPPRPSW